MVCVHNLSTREGGFSYGNMYRHRVQVWCPSVILVANYRLNVCI